MTISKIKGITVGSDSDYIVYGIDRGLVAETDDCQAAADALVADSQQCEAQGLLSDAKVYEATESGWSPVPDGVRSDDPVCG